MHQWPETVSYIGVSAKKLQTSHLKSLLNSYRCPARECHGAFKCQGNFVDSYAIATLEECIEKCNENEDCQWFTLEKANDHCIIYEECNDQFDCETCATGEKNCAHGYHGNYIATIDVQNKFLVTK